MSFLSRPQNGRARAIAEEHAGGTVRVIDVTGQQLGTDYQRVLNLPAANHGIRDRQAVQETGASSDDVHRRGLVRAQFRLDQTAGRRQNLIGRHGSTENQVDITRFDSRALDRLAGSANGKLRSVLARGRLVPLLDAGARCNPFVTGFDYLLEIGVGENAFRIGMTSAQDPCVNLHAMFVFVGLTHLLNWPAGGVVPRSAHSSFASCSLIHLNDFAALVIPALRTHAVLHPWFLAIRTDDSLGDAQGIMGAPLTAA